MKWLIVRPGHEIYMMILKQFTMPESREVLQKQIHQENYLRQITCAWLPNNLWRYSTLKKVRHISPHFSNADYA